MNRFVTMFLALAMLFGLAVALVPATACAADKKVEAKEGGAPPADAPKVDEKKRAAIRKLLAMTKAGDLGKATLDEVLPIFKQMAPDVPDAVWTKIFAKVDLAQFPEMLVPIYERRFETADVEAMIAFYETPVGRKFLQATPGIEQEHAAAMEAWGAKFGADVVADLEAQGYTLEE